MTHTDLKLTYVNNTFNSPVNEEGSKMLQPVLSTGPNCKNISKNYMYIYAYTHLGKEREKKERERSFITTLFAYLQLIREYFFKLFLKGNNDKPIA